VRLAVISDVHGNLTALEAVVDDISRRAIDRVVHGGDLALMGPRPGEVIDRIRELGWPGVVGNTDELLWRPEAHARQRDRAPQLHTLLRWLFDAYAPFTLEQIGEVRLAWLRDLPAELRIEEVTVVHAAPGDLWRAPMPDASDRDLDATYRPLGTGAVAYGHIHRPFRRAVGDLVIANAGSTGMPWDGDPRASYLLVDGGRVEVIRVEYDVESEANEFRRRAHPDGDRLTEMRRVGRFIKPNPFP
jgi:predicted phosphodiesterase